jgi:NAD dependent epimerase/dehydratase family enzyme
MTMSPDHGSIFDTLLALVRFGIGGTVGSGRQYVSWIHEADFVRSIEHLISHEEIEGAVNVASPNPLPNRDFLSELRTAWGTTIGLPAPRWMLEIGTFLLRTESELVLKSRCVVPGRLLRSGFQFKFPDWPAAAQELVNRWRKLHRSQV